MSKPIALTPTIHFHLGEWTPLKKIATAAGFTIAALAAITCVTVALTHYKILPSSLHAVNSLSNETAIKILAISGATTIISIASASAIVDVTRKKIALIKNRILNDDSLNIEIGHFKTDALDRINPAAKGEIQYKRYRSSNDNPINDKTKPFKVFNILYYNQSEKSYIYKYDLHYFSNIAERELYFFTKEVSNIEEI